jgi:hypothetical protein
MTSPASAGYYGYGNNYYGYYPHYRHHYYGYYGHGYGNYYGHGYGNYYGHGYGNYYSHGYGNDYGHGGYGNYGHGYGNGYGQSDAYQAQYRTGFQRGYQDGYGRNRFQTDGGGYHPNTGRTGPADTRDASMLDTQHGSAGQENPSPGQARDNVIHCRWPEIFHHTQILPVRPSNTNSARLLRETLTPTVNRGRNPVELP